MAVDLERVVVVGDAGDGDTGFVGQRLCIHGAELVAVDRDALPAEPPHDVDLVLLLGSARCGHSPSQRLVVDRESAYVQRTLDHGVPVLGICYGAQLLAHALGGSIGAAAQPEAGYLTVDSFDDTLCPPGPWAQLHSDAFTLAPTSVELGRSASGPQGFRDASRPGRALGWQFHPEVTPSEYVRWLASSAGTDSDPALDLDAVRREARAQEDDQRHRAYALTDAALTWLRG